MSTGGEEAVRDEEEEVEGVEAEVDMEALDVGVMGDLNASLCLSSTCRPMAITSSRERGVGLALLARFNRREEGEGFDSMMSLSVLSVLLPSLPLLPSSLPSTESCAACTSLTALSPFASSLLWFLFSPTVSLGSEEDSCLASSLRSERTDTVDSCTYRVGEGELFRTRESDVGH